jgi:hypothetical protein
MRELLFECPPLLLALFKIKVKTFILRLKLVCLLLERRVLVRRQCKALLENRRRTVLIDKALNLRKNRDVHVTPPTGENVVPPTPRISDTK